jgi:hypothetical protein
VPKVSSPAAPRRLSSRYGGEQARQEAIVRRPKNAIEAFANVAQAKALPIIEKLSLQAVNAMYGGDVNMDALRNAERQGVSFLINRALPAMGVGGQYNPLTREVSLAPGASRDVFSHEFGIHAQQHINPIMTLLKLPLRTAVEQLPYSGVGYWATPLARQAIKPQTRTAAFTAGQTSVGTFGQKLSNAWSEFRNFNYATDPRERLAWVAQGQQGTLRDRPNYASPRNLFGDIWSPYDE